jgi:hypothetical protein
MIFKRQNEQFLEIGSGWKREVVKVIQILIVKLDGWRCHSLSKEFGGRVGSVLDLLTLK